MKKVSGDDFIPCVSAGYFKTKEIIEIVRAVNSHEAAQRLAEAVAKKCPYHHLPLLNGWAHSINRDTGLMGDKKTVRCTIPEEERAALAEWEAVK